MRWDSYREIRGTLENLKDFFSWEDPCDDLDERDLRGVKLIFYYGFKGVQKAIGGFLESSWQKSR
jgi:hypothetical protein